MPAEVDVIVIGAGHNGLTCGAYLARAGLSVHVLERADRIGGMAISAPLIPEAPNHLVSPCALDGIFLGPGGVADDLGLARYGFTHSAHGGYGWLGRNGESLAIVNDIEATVSDIARYSPRDAERYRELATVGMRAVALQDRLVLRPPGRPPVRDILTFASTLARDKQVRQLLADTLSRSAVDLIESTFESEPVRSLFANVATGLGGPNSVDSGAAMLFSSMIHRHGFTRVHRGFGGLVDALAAHITDHGGCIDIGCEVIGIMADRGRAAGIELADGRSIKATRGVVAAIAPQQMARLADKLLPEQVAAAARMAPANADGVGPFTVNVALSEELSFPAHQPDARTDLRQLTLTTGTFDEVVAAYEHAKCGRVGNPPPWWISALRGSDGNAPAGQDTAWIYATVPVTPSASWPDVESPLADAILYDAARYAPSLDQAILGRYLENPSGLAERVATPNGCIYHVDPQLTRQGPLRPTRDLAKYRTPAAGLYLTGVGTHPGAGVSGLPGKYAAAALLRS